jgi:protein-S-isoprenylcysteine O-methyltransferase Ste14
MLALTLEAARNIAILAVVGFIALSVASALIIKNITGKIVMILVFAGFALGVWTQRTNLTTCADQVKNKAEAGDTTATSCTFFGRDVEISLPGA